VNTLSRLTFAALLLATWTAQAAEVMNFDIGVRSCRPLTTD
jgi:hypothetical protein